MCEFCKTDVICECECFSIEPDNYGNSVCEECNHEYDDLKAGVL